MAHYTSDSAGSRSSVSLISSASSVEAYQEPKLQNQISAVKQSPVSIGNLVQQAEAHVSKFAAQENRIFQYGAAKADLSKVLSAMLFHAEEAGGEPSRRYVAAAIIASATVDPGEDWAVRLRDLAITWLTHLLYIFKSSRSHGTQQNIYPSEVATPTLQDAVSLMDNAVGSRKSSFRDNLILRDWFRCVVTGIQDREHPHPEPALLQVRLEAAHFLPRAIADFDNDPTSPSFRSASATFDILVNFIRLPADKLETLSQCIDDPSNGMMLGHNAHDGFDDLQWCLQRVANDTYEIKILGPFPGLQPAQAQDAIITFRDRSSAFRHGESDRGVPTPNPVFVGLHAAIAGVMHLSGAGKFFDELLDKYRDDSDSTPLLRWTDVENLIKEEQTREILTLALGEMKISA